VHVEWRWTAYEHLLGGKSGRSNGRSDKDSAEAVWEQAARNVRTFVGQLDDLFAI
jgi:hypothetical protein